MIHRGMSCSPEQIKSARIFLHMPQAKLAEIAHVSVATIERIENNTISDRERVKSVGRVMHALEREGVEFFSHGLRCRGRKDSYLDKNTYLEKKKKLIALSKRCAAELKDCQPFDQDDLYDENGLPA